MIIAVLVNPEIIRGITAGVNPKCNNLKLIEKTAKNVLCGVFCRYRKGLDRRKNGASKFFA